MRKRILIFSSAYTPYEGGAEIAIKEITDRSPDFVFDLITLRYDKELPSFERIGNVNVYRIGFALAKPSMEDLVRFPAKFNKYLFTLTAYLKARKLNQKHSYDMIWAMMAAYAGFAAMIYKSLHKKTPYLLSLQEGDPLDEILAKVKWVKPLFKRIFLSADMIQVISKYLVTYARQVGYQGEVRVIPNAVDLAVFSTDVDTQELQKAKDELGKQSGDIFLITTSRLVKKNGIADVIKALKQLERKVKFVVIGDGPDENKLKSLSAELGLGERVIFLGKRKQTELPKYLIACDVFIRPSLSEGLGNSFLEAMAAGLPVIATRVGGIPDFLFAPEDVGREKATGLYCEPENSQDIAKQIEILISEGTLQRQLSQNAKELVVRDFNWDKISMAMNKIFHELSKK